jgi:hypothetical protein
VDIRVPLDIAEDPPAVDKVKGTIFIREVGGVSAGDPDVRVEVAAGGSGKDSIGPMTTARADIKGRFKVELRELGEGGCGL